MTKYKSNVIMIIIIIIVIIITIMIKIITTIRVHVGKLNCIIFKPLHYSHGKTEHVQSPGKISLPSSNAKPLSN